MKKRIIFIILMILLISVLSSCKKIKKCNSKGNEEFYCQIKHLENKEYVDYLLNTLSLKFNEKIELEYSSGSVFSEEDDYMYIFNYAGHCASCIGFTPESFYDVMMANCKDMKLFKWNFFFGGNYYVTKDIISYAILHGEPTKKDKFLYYNNLPNDKETYLVGYDYEEYLTISSLNIPSEATYIMSYAFVRDEYLTSVKCNDSLKYIGHMSFMQCLFLKHLELNYGLKGIGTYAFKDCNIDYVVIPNSVVEIGSEAFTHGDIFCENFLKPKGWADDWAAKEAKVYWRSEWEYNSEGIPVPISE